MLFTGWSQFFLFPPQISPKHCTSPPQDGRPWAVSMAVFDRDPPSVLHPQNGLRGSLITANSTKDVLCGICAWKQPFPVKNWQLWRWLPRGGSTHRRQWLESVELESSLRHHQSSLVSSVSGNESTGMHKHTAVDARLGTENIISKATPTLGQRSPETDKHTNIPHCYCKGIGITLL